MIKLLDTFTKKLGQTLNCLPGLAFVFDIHIQEGTHSHKDLPSPLCYLSWKICELELELKDNL